MDIGSRESKTVLNKIPFGLQNEHLNIAVYNH